MTLAHFLITLHAFITAHACQVWQPDSSGLGQHIVYGGNCRDALDMGRELHATVTWSGVDQGTITFP